jgi:hypothetical protein
MTVRLQASALGEALGAGGSTHGIGALAELQGLVAEQQVGGRERAFQARLQLRRIEAHALRSAGARPGPDKAAPGAAQAPGEAPGEARLASAARRRSNNWSAASSAMSA